MFSCQENVRYPELRTPSVHHVLPFCYRVSDPMRTSFWCVPRTLLYFFSLKKYASSSFKTARCVYRVEYSCCYEYLRMIKETEKLGFLFRWAC